MNDKCASGTGATIDKCMIKVGAEPGFATSLHFSDHALHHVAAKCGVFAETDIVNLVKTGIPSDTSSSSGVINRSSSADSTACTASWT